MTDTMLRAASFLDEDQFTGFLGSLGLSQSTMFGYLGAFSSVSARRSGLFSTSSFFEGYVCRLVMLEWSEMSVSSTSFGIIMSRWYEERT